MTDLLARAFAEAAKLPDAEQEALARLILEEIETEHLWLGVLTGENIVWCWIGSHGVYDRLVASL